MNIVFFGASHTAGTGLGDRTARFATIVASTLTSVETNLGVDGSQAIGRDDNGMLISDNSGIARVPDVIDADADKVLVLYGEDDWKSAGDPGNPELFRQGTFLWDYDTIVRGLLDAQEQEQVVLITIPALDYTKTNSRDLSIAAYNNQIRHTASKYDLTLVDPENEAASLFEAADFDSDGNLTHPGHNKVAQLLAAHPALLRI